MSDQIDPGPYDLAVVGAGSAGFSAAITAADLGARVLLIGHGSLGGTCVNTGCVPSKTMIRAAEAVHSSHALSRFPGLKGLAATADWTALIAAKDSLVATLRRQKYTELLPHYPLITYTEGRARFVDGQLNVGGTHVNAAKILIATGASPALPDIPGLQGVPYLTSTTALALEDRPTSLLVLGGGYIGCELAQMFARLGTDVTLVTRSKLLPRAEPEISRALAGYLREEGIRIVDGIAYESIASGADGIVLRLRDKEGTTMLAAQRVLVTTGRQPNTTDLGLEHVGIERDERDAIVVDRHMRTGNPDIYAAGDVTGRDQFVYMAAYGAKLAARNALNEEALEYDNSSMPWVIFTDPQVAGVGLSEAEATASGYTVKTSTVALDQVPRALAARDTRGLIKLVADAGTDRLLGGQILAPEGGDSIQTLAMALKTGLTSGALGDLLFPYLTTVEGLKLAAQAFDKDVSKLSCCAG